MVEINSFGCWMKRARKTLDLSQKELAGRVGCAVVTIQKIEEGRRRPSLQIARLLSTALKIAPEQQEDFIRLARSPGGNTLPGRTGSAAGVYPAGNLPAQATQLVGRAQEIETLLGRLRNPRVRLVTLTGPPGVGKTRLAVETAVQAGQAMIENIFSGGVWFVPLAALHDPDLVLPAIARVWSLTGGGSSDLIVRVGVLLRGKSLLLLIDNCEHLLDAAPQFARLLAACPGLKILATSRVPLEIYGETVIRLEPLELPEECPADDPDCVRKASAVALFVERAEAVRPGFVLQADNAAQVVHLCRRFEGLPLAIELAAAGLYRHSLDELSAAVDSSSVSTSALQNSPRDFSDRQRSLERAVAWSYDLLAETEQQVFRGLGIFQGSFSRHAVIKICAVPGGPSPERTARAIKELVRHSLMREVTELGPEPRFETLEMIREDALTRSAQTGELDNLRERHADWYLEIISGSPWEGNGFNDHLALARAEEDNLRAALGWLVNQADGLRALKMCTSLRWYWEFGGHLVEGVDWLRRCLALPGQVPADLRAQALRDGSILAFQQGDYLTAQLWGEESLRLVQNEGQIGEIALLELSLGRFAIEQGLYADAEAREERALQLYRSIDDCHGEAGALAHLAEAALGKGDVGAAKRLGEESLAISSGTGGAFWDALVEGVLCEIALQAGELDQACVHLVSSLDTAQAYQAIRPVTMALGLAAGLIFRLPGDPLERARKSASIWGAVTGLRQSRGLTFSTGHRERLNSYLAPARDSLGDPGWQQAEENGHSLSLEGAVSLARSLLEVGSPVSRKVEPLGLPR